MVRSKKGTNEKGTNKTKGTHNMAYKICTHKRPVCTTLNFLGRHGQKCYAYQIYPCSDYLMSEHG